MLKWFTLYNSDQQILIKLGGELFYFVEKGILLLIALLIEILRDQKFGLLKLHHQFLHIKKDNYKLNI